VDEDSIKLARNDFLFASKRVYLLASLVSTSNVAHRSRVIFLIRRGSRSDRLRLVRNLPVPLSSYRLGWYHPTGRHTNNEQAGHTLFKPPWTERFSCQRKHVFNLHRSLVALSEQVMATAGCFQFLLSRSLQPSSPV